MIIVTGVHKYSESFSLVGGINAPKKISCFGTDGIERPELVKVIFDNISSFLILRGK